MAKKMVDMRLSDEDKKGMSAPLPIAEPSDYPYHLCIALTHREMAKLGLQDDVQVDDLLHFTAMAKVTAINKGDGPAGPHCRVELQIEHMMAMEDENTEGEGRSKDAKRKALYDHGEEDEEEGE